MTDGKDLEKAEKTLEAGTRLTPRDFDRAVRTLKSMRKTESFWKRLNKPIKSDWGKREYKECKEAYDALGVALFCLRQREEVIEKLKHHEGVRVGNKIYSNLIQTEEVLGFLEKAEPPQKKEVKSK